MKTIVEIRKDRDFSARNLGFINVEAPIAMPATGLLGAFRTKQNLANSQSPAGPWAGLLEESSPAPDYDAISMTGIDQARRLAIPGDEAGISSGSASIVVVAYFASGVRAAPAGWNNISASGLYFQGVSNGSTCNLLNRSAEGTTVGNAAFTVIPNRWELLVGVRNSSDNTLKIYHPRLDAVVSVSTSTHDAISNTDFVIGSAVAPSPGASRTAFAAAYDRVLTTGEIASIYASAQATLAASGIEI